MTAGNVIPEKASNASQETCCAFPRAALGAPDKTTSATAVHATVIISPNVKALGQPGITRRPSIPDNAPRPCQSRQWVGIALRAEASSNNNTKPKNPAAI